MTQSYEGPEQSVDRRYSPDTGDCPADDVVRVYRSGWGATAPIRRELVGVWLRTLDDHWVREDQLERCPGGTHGAGGLYRLQHHTFADLLLAQGELYSASVHADDDFYGLWQDDLLAGLTETEQALADALDEAGANVEHARDGRPRWHGGGVAEEHPRGTPLADTCPWAPRPAAALGGPTHRLEDIDAAISRLFAAITQSRRALNAIRDHVNARRIARWRCDLDLLADRADAAVRDPCARNHLHDGRPTTENSG